MESLLPPTHRALLLPSRSAPLHISTTQPTPTPTPGSAIIRILAAGILSYSGQIYTAGGGRDYAFPTPLVPGASAIGRIAAVGPDATLLAPGALVLLDVTIRARDDPDGAIMLSGIVEGSAPKLMRGEWRDSTYAEFVRMPLENCIAVDEARLCGELGYAVEELLAVSTMAVAFGGLDDVGVRPGETVVVAPATGKFGGAAVRVALAMGARVVAMGRNGGLLEELRGLGGPGGRVEVVRISGDVEGETEALKKLGPIDVWFDISPPMAAGSSHLRSVMGALRRGGRVSLMGGVPADFSFNYRGLMRQNITIKGTWMYTREQYVRLLQIVTAGILPLGKKNGLNIVGKFGLEQWKEAFDAAAERSGPGESVIFVP
ncbi:alcohol dehydrogenase [Lasiodiplodia theobromae]|uniref:alcohol dehydrogenase n=1 Tax=Lasiodiplodia theobromae TaxID=45133 RepID=UPI0015C32FAA|nr:alcohol dehydrogenase [Lasiodiplodia theobromae]KAF4542055.1 alcohol dehydrogenase [Lasiodiplodia theobromae]